MPPCCPSPVLGGNYLICHDVMVDRRRFSASPRIPSLSQGEAGFQRSAAASILGTGSTQRSRPGSPRSSRTAASVFSSRQEMAGA